MSARGFTLIEVIVGLTVSALALSAGFATLGFIADREGPTDAAVAMAMRGATTRRLLVDWLSEARLRSPNGTFFLGYEGEERGRPTDEIMFPTSASTPIGVGTTVVRLFIDTDEKTPERGLVAEMTERILDEPRYLELVPEAGSMRVRYLMSVEGSAGEWITVWSERRLPRAVELTFTAVPPDTLPSLLRYPILVPMETTR
jgi:prepilin-type N-terminal cleavage/methylation domain-containing protein